jgi:hypothetical protein
MKLIPIFVISCVVSCFAQTPNNAPFSAASSQSFTADSGKPGDASGNVNLFTGDVQFPLLLSSLPGRNGLNASLTISYSSNNVSNQAQTWNFESATGVVGLGWSLDYPKILVDNKMTGTREDDTYYMSEGGGANELVYVGATSGIKEYKPKNHQFWNIKYYVTEDKWVIVKEDGSKLVYGDKNSGRSTVQWIVTHGNWIGSSSVTTSTLQKQQAFVWNLSEMQNIWGEKMLFTYLNQNQKVGSTAGKEYTEASYLQKITNTFNQSINLVYSDKLAAEYVDPHSENGTNQIDAYQERYEQKYLDFVSVTDADGTVMSKTKLYYSFMGAGTLTKRLLTGMQVLNASDQGLPGYNFEYITQGQFSEVNYGALKAVKVPAGGRMTYQYEKKAISRSVRDRWLAEIPGYAEPKIWFGSDYVITTWRQLDSNGYTSYQSRPVKVRVFSWEGEWIEWNLDVQLPNIEIVGNDGILANSGTPYKYQDFKVTVQEDFFSILYKNQVSGHFETKIFRRHDTKRAFWESQDFTFSTLAVSKVTDVSLVSGEKFVAVSSFRSNSIFILQRKNASSSSTSWVSSSVTRASTSQNFNHIYAGHNYIISHVERWNSPSDEIKFYFLKEDGTWLSRIAPSLPAAYTASTWDKKSYYYPSASFALGMIDLNNEMIFSWDENFNLLPTYNMGVSGISDNSYVNIVENSMVGIVDQSGTDVKGYALRFDGQTWHYTSQTNYCSKSITGSRTSNSYGSDFFIWPSCVPNTVTATMNTLNRKVFNPNTSTWNTSTIQAQNSWIFFAGPTYMITGDITPTSNYRLWWRGTNGVFSMDPTVIGTTFFNAYHAQGGTNFVIGTSFAHYGMNGLKIKNGAIDMAQQNLPLGIAGSLHPPRYNSFDPTHDLTTHNSFVSFMNGSAQFSSTQLKLHRVVDWSATGAIADFPVVSIGVDDGKTIITTTLDYDLGTAVFDPSSTICFYNKVKVYPGGNPSNYPQGYTENLFHNGLKNVEVGNTFPAGSYGLNFDDFSKMLIGISYRSNVHNSLGALVASNSSTFNISAKDIGPPGNIVGKAYYARPDRSVKVIDGITNLTTTTYDSNTGLLLSTTTQRGSDDVYGQQLRYWWSDYDPTRSKNILSLISQTKTLINGQVVDATAIKYKDWGSNLIPAPWKSYSWNRVGQPDFSAWASGVEPNSSNWRLLSTVDLVDPVSGLTLQATDGKGLIISTVWSTTRQQMLANITNASFDKVRYAGFEEVTGPNISSVAKTGFRSYTGAYNMVLPSPGTYQLSYWRKTNINAPWELVTSVISANTTIGGTGMWVDEIRLLPVDADMTTTSYDRFGNVVAQCNATNEIIYYEYDEYQRAKLIKDKDGNIVKLFTYTSNQ